jgi:multisubunit Na+/H+ antiporter MnhE subunit
MTMLLSVAGLAAIYLLVLTSVAPGDVLVGVLLALALVLTGRRRGAPRNGRHWGRWGIALATIGVTTLRDMAVGSVRVARFCLRDDDRAGFVEIPRGDRSRHAVAMWGVLTGEAPDEYPVTIDAGGTVLVVHTLDARDPDAVRARHAAARERHQQDVVP